VLATRSKFIHVPPHWTELDRLLAVCGRWMSLCLTSEQRESKPSLGNELRYLWNLVDFLFNSSVNFTGSDDSSRYSSCSISSRLHSSLFGNPDIYSNVQSDLAKGCIACECSSLLLAQGCSSKLYDSTIQNIATPPPFLLEMGQCMSHKSAFCVGLSGFHMPNSWFLGARESAPDGIMIISAV